MPIFNVDVDFEVYCDTCGAGLCNESTIGRTYRRNELCVRVNACPACISEKNAEIEDLKAQIEDLQTELSKHENN